MDLSFSRFEADGTVTALPPDLAVLMVGVAARQAASPTALLQARLPAQDRVHDWFAPAHGAFNRAVAQGLGARANDVATDEAGVYRAALGDVQVPAVSAVIELEGAPAPTRGKR